MRHFRGRLVANTCLSECTVHKGEFVLFLREQQNLTLLLPIPLLYFQHAHFIPILGVGREANINWSMVICQGSTRSELP